MSVFNVVTMKSNLSAVFSFVYSVVFVAAKFSFNNSVSLSFGEET